MTYCDLPDTCERVLGSCTRRSVRQQQGVRAVAAACMLTDAGENGNRRQPPAAFDDVFVKTDSLHGDQVFMRHVRQTVPRACSTVKNQHHHDISLITT
eukprot:6178172-Pleurochrysis_carterae.AAC.6